MTEGRIRPYPDLFARHGGETLDSELSSCYNSTRERSPGVPRFG